MHRSVQPVPTDKLSITLRQIPTSCTFLNKLTISACKPSTTLANTPLSSTAGGGSYYFAKRSINADRASRHEADMRRKRQTEQLEFNAMHATATKKPQTRATDHAASPSGEASEDPAPTERQLVPEKSRYEPKELYRAKKGDRFS